MAAATPHKVSLVCISGELVLPVPQLAVTLVQSRWQLTCGAEVEAARQAPASARTSRPSGLSDREVEVLRLVPGGCRISRSRRRW